MAAAGADTWQCYRQRMLAETSLFIEWGLAHPEEVVEIPSKPVEQGSFPRAVADWFWSTALSAEADGLVGRWRSRLQAVSRILPKRR